MLGILGVEDVPGILDTTNTSHTSRAGSVVGGWTSHISHTLTNYSLGMQLNESKPYNHPSLPQSPTSGV